MRQPGESAGRQLWRILCPCLAYYLINVLVSLVFLAVTYVIAGSGGADSAQQQEVWNGLMQRCNYAMTVVMAAVGIPFFLCWLRRDRKKELAGGTVFSAEKATPLSLLFSLLLGAAACILVNHGLEILGLTEKYAEDVERVKNVLYQGNLIWELIGVGFLAPIAEELVFRGMTQRRMRESLGPWMSILIASLLFAAMHGNFLQGVFAFLLGLLMGYVYERCHTLTAPILLHIGANLVSVVVSDTDWLSFLYQNTWCYLTVTAGAAILTCFLIFYFTRLHSDPHAGR